MSSSNNEEHPEVDGPPDVVFKLATWHQRVTATFADVVLAGGLLMVGTVLSGADNTSIIYKLFFTVATVVTLWQIWQQG